MAASLAGRRGQQPLALVQRLPVLLLAASAPRVGSQLQPDIEQIMASHPGCFHKGFQYTPDIPGTHTQATSITACQEMCRDMANCKVFAFFPNTKDCYFGDWYARMVESHAGAIAGHGVCPQPTQLPPDICRTELPNDGFPGLDANRSNQAWPSGRQPWSLECWPKNWTGGYIPCQGVQVLEDTSNKWPGKCHGLTQQLGNAYTPMDPTTRDDCKNNCMQNPLCPSWQTGFYGKCWQGVGERCFVRQNFNPMGAQRLQHGKVRKLMDLAGWQIVGLFKSFDNADGFFLETTEAVDACKRVCYSDIRCQYWQYSPTYGCFVEDASKDYSPPYPLTLDWAYRSTQFALSVVAGEFIQHYCPDHLTTSYPTEAPEELASCMKTGSQFSPRDMPFQQRTLEMNAAACQGRCRRTVDCGHFTYWPDGGCHLQAQTAIETASDDSRVISGPPSCTGSTPAPQINVTAAGETNWLTAEGEEALNGNVPGPNIPASAIAPTPAPRPRGPVASSQPGLVASGSSSSDSASPWSAAGAAPAPAPSSNANRLVQLSVAIQNLDSNSLTYIERRQLKVQYLSALSNSLGMPVSDIRASPSGQVAQVQLKSSPPSACQLLAYVPNRPAGSSDTSVLQGLLASSKLAVALQGATTSVLGTTHGAIRGSIEIEDQTATLSDATPLTASPASPAASAGDDSCDFFCQSWPLFLGLGLLICGIGLVAAIIFFRPQTQKKSRALLDYERESSFAGSDFDSRLSDGEEGDASIWASEPAWDSPSRRATVPPRDSSLSEMYSGRRGDTIFEA